jgi:hypothetical protein
MMKIYVDSEKHCHKTNPDNAFVEVETDFFDGKCDAFIEGFCYDTSKGYPQIYSWKPYDQLTAAQTQYEADLAEIASAYQEGVDSVWT